MVLKHELGLRYPQGISLLLSSAVPEGKGVSSSAAVEVAVMQALCAAHDVHIDGRHLALLCQKVTVRSLNNVVTRRLKFMVANSACCIILLKFMVAYNAWCATSQRSVLKLFLEGKCISICPPKGALMLTFDWHLSDASLLFWVVAHDLSSLSLYARQSIHAKSVGTECAKYVG